jgi:glutamine amidotransferase
MLRRVGVTATVISDPNDLDGTSAVILPGVGHFDNCARNLRRKGFASALEDIVLRQQVPLLGICVGAQLLTRGSEEGDELGLGWVQAITVRFMPPVHSALKVPHMGWNTVEPVQSVELFESDGTRPRFYFVHSYFIRCDDRKSILCSTNYGGEFA